MLRVRGLSLRYPNGKLALTDFSLTVEAGELVVVLGGNGSGKTTLLRCITRTVKPNAGEVWLGDTDLCALEGEKLRRARLELAIVWQHASLVRRRSVLANVATGALGRHYTLQTMFGGLPAASSKRRAAISPKSAWPIWPSSAPARCRAARPSASPSRAPWHSGRGCCWPTSRSRASIRKRPKRSCASCSGWRAPSASPCSACCIRSSWPTTTPTAWSASGDGRIAFDLPRSEVSRDAVHRLYISEERRHER